MSTFHGLEVARKALFAQQRGLYTTGHNIANVNTEGYSRQRSNFVASAPYPPQTFFKPKIPGQMGTGVEIGTVQRVRDQFLDFQYRLENSRTSYWAKRSEAMSRMEELLNEPSENGLATTIDRFWQSLHDLVDNVDNAGARSVVAHRGLAVAETLNYLSRSLQSIRADLKDQIEVSVGHVNSLVRQINDINGQIVKIEPHGLLPNDLYDERDRLIDELSKYVNVRVHYTSSSEGAPEIADGLASIELLDSQGNSIGNGVFLLDVRGVGSLKDSVNEFKVEYSDSGHNEVTRISVSGYDGVEDLALLDAIGSISALVKAYGYENPDEGEVNYPYILDQLDQLARALAEEFNNQHEKGFDVANGEQVVHFFVNTDGDTDPALITAENLTVNQEILNNPNLIAASLPGEGSQNANNALALAEVFDKPNTTYLNGASIRDFYTLLIGEIGVKGQEAMRMKENTEVLRVQVDEQRQSVTAVSLDEEMTNLIKFQHAYNAAARNITALDEMLDRIINNMGLVGR